MPATLLSLIQSAAREMALPSPSTVIGNSTQDVVQLLALANAAGGELARGHPWQQLAKEYRFTTVFYQYTANLVSGNTTISGLSSTTGLTTTPTYFQVTGAGIPQDTFLVSVAAGPATAVLTQAPTQTANGVTLTFSQMMYALPSDYDRLTDRTQWDKSQHWEMLGPETPQQWQWLKSGYISSGPRVRFRVMGNLFRLWPTLGAAHYLGWEYLSGYWATSSSASIPDKSAFSADTDTCIFPDRLMVLAVKLKYFETKGFDTTAIYRDYLAQLDLAKSHDGGSPTLSMCPKPSSVLVGWENIPDANYGS